ncbi:hypothetical protein X975_26770, partial [Stegodyphus mimosarum]
MNPMFKDVMFTHGFSHIHNLPKLTTPLEVTDIIRYLNVKKAPGRSGPWKYQLLAECLSIIRFEHPTQDTVLQMERVPESSVLTFEAAQQATCTDCKPIRAAQVLEPLDSIVARLDDLTR